METSVTPTQLEDELCKRANPVTLSDVLDRLGGKWTVLIIRQLSEGPARFSEIKRGIEGVSQKMLTSTLRDLERDGLVTRTVTPSIPPRVDYELTDLGRDLREPLKALHRWADKNRGLIEESRHRFEEREAAERAQDWSVHQREPLRRAG